MALPLIGSRTLLPRFVARNRALCRELRIGLLGGPISWRGRCQNRPSGARSAEKKFLP